MGERFGRNDNVNRGELFVTNHGCERSLRVARCTPYDALRYSASRGTLQIGGRRRVLPAERWRG